MNTPQPPNSQPTAYPAAIPGQSHTSPDSLDSSTKQWLFTLWDGRHIILASVIACLALGAAYLWLSAPRYAAVAMIQIQAQKTGNSGTFPRLEGLLPEPADAQAEIEILMSNQVLGRVVEALGMDIVVRPKTMPIIGEAILRSRAWRPTLRLDMFQIPEVLKGERFLLTCMGDNVFKLALPGKGILATGRVGMPLSQAGDAGPLEVKVSAMDAKPGQVFTIIRKPLLQTIEEARKGLAIAERSKLTNVLGLNYQDASPEKSAEFLNELLQQYLKHYQEKRSASAARILASLKSQLPELRQKLDASENHVNLSRSHTGAADLSREADLLLQQSTALKVQISGLRQKRDELLRTYTEKADVVSTVNRQITQLLQEDAALEQRLRSLPMAQQEQMRLSRDLQVNTALYSGLLSNMEQVQIYSASDPGNVAIVDRAFPDPEPVFPRKKSMIALFAFIGCMAGTGLAFLRSLMRRGIEDYRIVETKLMIPVLETIPHSETEAGRELALRRQRKGMHVMALTNPKDPAMEGLRGLRTMLHISMKNQPSRVIMISGPSPSIGKSFISTNLAVLFAQAGARVLLVDADLRRGGQHLRFGLEHRGVGFSEVLAGSCQWQDALTPVQSVTDQDVTAQFRLNLITTGQLPPNPSELLLSHRLADFLSEAAEAFDYVILDAAPLLAVTDTTILAAKVDSVLLTAKYGHHPIEELWACKNRLEKHGIPLTGCVVNDIPSSGLAIFHPYRYAYQYGY